jgi:hypothetical protein
LAHIIKEAGNSKIGGANWIIQSIDVAVLIFFFFFGSTGV